MERNEKLKMIVRSRTFIAAAAITGLLLLVMISYLTVGFPQKSDRAPEETRETLPEYTVPPDGNPEDVTCLGSYSLPGEPEEPVAKLGWTELNNGELAVFYQLAINGFSPEAGQSGPDFGRPLEGQLVPGEDITWQQHFLRQALDTWHTLAALEQKSREPALRVEENFHPSEHLHTKYMTDMPINDILYSEDGTFRLNRMHGEYLDQLPQKLADTASLLGYETPESMVAGELPGVDRETLEKAARLANYAYMYFTDLTYDQVPTEQEVLSRLYEGEDRVVDVRQILLRPEHAKLTPEGKVIADQDQWDICEAQTNQFLVQWNGKWRNEARFANKARQQSQDARTKMNGGLYENIRKGQLIEPLNSWCFDPQREPGDVEVLKSEYGFHILYFCGSRDAGYEETANKILEERMEELLEQIREEYPMEVTYEKITLPTIFGHGDLSLEAHLLYPDLAHERISEVPVYIQQDYLSAPYGGYNVSSHGCGITSLAMLSTYMGDDYLTPGKLAARYGRYNSEHGTDAGILYETPPDMGYYLRERSYNWEDAKAALEEGRIVINLQHKGYFTGGGHYLVLTGLTEEGDVIIRDSNVYNYGKLPEHKQDHFPPERLLGAAQGFWIYDYKILSYPICARCGDCPRRDDPDMENAPNFLTEDYLCPRCRAALERRSVFLSLTALQ